MSWHRIRTMTTTELQIARRDGEQLLLTLGLPLLFLVFFSQVDVLPTSSTEPIDFIAPGILTLALLSVAFVRPAISLGFDRSFGAIKRFATTPLRVSEFLVAKLIATLAVFVVQVMLIVSVGMMLNWRPALTATTVVALLFGLVTFSSLAIALSSVIDGLTSLAVANAIYVVLLMLSGLVFDLEKLPSAIAAFARLLPTTALVEIVRHQLSPEAFLSPGNRPWTVLTLWLVASVIGAWRLFRWE